jgi:hypothetical protein
MFWFISSETVFEQFALNVIFVAFRDDWLIFYLALFFFSGITPFA